MSKMKCHECECEIDRVYVSIFGEAWCVECAGEYLENELFEHKRDNKLSWLEKVAYALDYQILEV